MLTDTFGRSIIYLRSCLLLDGEVHIRETLRKSEPMLLLIWRAAQARPRDHELTMKHYPESRRMAEIGG